MILTTYLAYYFLTTIEVTETKPITSVSNRIVFPDQEEIMEFVPKCEENRTFCEDVENYPENVFHEVLQNSAYKEEYFSSSGPEVHISDVGDRFHPETDFYLCDSLFKTQFPRAARNVRNEWKFVYNFDRYKQAVTTEECKDATSSCTPGAPREIKTRCMQKYSDILLLVADQEGSPVWDLFWFPTACVCSYEPTINFNYSII